MPDKEPTDIAQHIYAAARVDMEFQNNLASARHYVENLLNAFSQAVCTRNEPALEELVRSVAIGLAGDTSRSRATPERIIGWFGHTNAIAAQTISNISVRFEDKAVFYSAVYQDWETGPPPYCSAIGKFNGRLRTGPQVWRWEEHEMTALNGVDGRQITADRQTPVTAGTPYG